MGLKMAGDLGGENGCRICGNQLGNRLHRAREMFAGTRDAFTYDECAACGTIQLKDVPDLRPYYATDYYSFQPAIDKSTAQHGFKKRLSVQAGEFVRRRVAAYYCRRRASFGEYRHLIGRYLSKRMERVIVGFPEYLKDTHLDLHLTPRSPILDVGSGAGLTLLALGHFGFDNLTGVDPFLEESINYDNGVRVLKGEMADLNQQFDLILANHSIEHFPDPRGALKEMYRLLKPGHYAIIRTPVISQAWRQYGTNWVQLDPPRHLFLFKAQTLCALAEETGFSVREVSYDSTAFQFWGSEQYARDIPLVDERSYYVNPDKSPFSSEQLTDFAAQAAKLNRQGEGDQAVFYLYKDLRR